MTKQDWVYDIETFPNFYSATFLNITDPDQIKQFVICWQYNIDEKEKLSKFLNEEVEILIGYNNLYFDSPITEFVCDYNGKNLNADVYEMVQGIINSDRGENFAHRNKNFKNKQLDLMKLMAFDKLGISLKQCAINLGWHKIQDLPLPYDHNVERDEIELVLKYNINDVLITYELYKELQPQINLRIELGKLYDVDVTSASDSKIANTLLEKFYSEETGIEIKNLRYLRTKRDFLWLKDCLCSNIKFQSHKMRELKFEIANTLVVAENNYAFKKKFQFANCSYEIGIGGLHSNDAPGIFKTDDNFIIRDLDVSSYYPSIMIINKIKPEHLSEHFTTILEKITKERIDAKATGNKVKADGLKITVNSIFGKLGSETFWLHDPKAMLSVTVSGQLYLLMLIEALSLAGIMVISANTDGIVCKIDRKLENKYKEICDWWQNKTGFQLEFTDYEIYVRSDVNNYLTKKHGDKTKEKGKYVQEINLKRALHYPIVSKCFYEHFINNKTIDEVLHAETSILEFCISQKTGKDFILEARTDDGQVEQLQKTNRFYVSNTGCSLVKVNKTKGTEIGLYVGNKCQILNDYDKSIPINEYDINYDFYKQDAEKYICDIEDAKFSDEVIIEEACSPDEIEQEIDFENFDTSKIIVVPPRFRYSKASYIYDKSSNTIYRGIGNIKYVTPNVAKELQKISKDYFPDFVTFLVKVSEELTVNSRQMETLIKLGYFQEFGNNKKLLKVFEEFQGGKSKYNKKLKNETKQKRSLTLQEYEKSLPDEKLSILDQIYFEQETLGNIQTTFSVDKRYCYVLTLDDTYSPKLLLHCLANGKTMLVKMQKGIYDQKPVLGGDIIYTKTFQHKNAVRYDNGMFIEDESKPKVWWLQNLDVLNNDQIEKLI